MDQQNADKGKGSQADRARPSPQTDPTNPWHQEAAGVWVANENASERRVDEEGLTDEDRARR